jgi:uncharacterized membrane protein YfcA
MGAVAFFYALVGHGGASGYQALGALMGQPLGPLRAQALLMNVGVAGLAGLAFTRAGHLRWRLILPLCAASVPAAYFAGRLLLPQAWAQGALAVALAGAALRLAAHGWMERSSRRQPVREAPWAALLLVGAGLGVLSGLTSVGGGIYLSPLLILLAWADMKETAAASAVFIVVNSASGLLAKPALLASTPLPASWMIFTLLGGAAGAWLGAGRLPSRRLAQALAVSLLLAALKLGWQAFG